MAWKAPKTPRERKAAVNWFRSRVPVTDKEFRKLERDAKRQAFTIAGATQLGAVQMALDELARAVKRGDGFDAFLERLRQKLGVEYVDKNSGRLKTTFQTTTQTALNAGRWEQGEDPKVRRKKPYRLYDPTLDDRTTDLCWKLKRVVVPAGHWFLRTRWPPLHYNCRTQVRNVSEATAKRMGITPASKLHGLKAMPGFGHAPHTGDDWTPDSDAYDSRAYRTFKDKQRKRQPKLELSDAEWVRLAEAVDRFLDTPA